VMNCLLCGAADPAREYVGIGALQVVCRSPSCGQYSISVEATRRLAEGGPNKQVLVEMVRRANERSRVLDIFVADDGLLQADELVRSGESRPTGS
jgi:hypothetical protein